MLQNDAFATLPPTEVKIAEALATPMSLLVMVPDAKDSKYTFPPARALVPRTPLEPALPVTVRLPPDKVIPAVLSVELHVVAIKLVGSFAALAPAPVQKNTRPGLLAVLITSPTK